MLYWCIKNCVVMICFTILAIVFDDFWIILLSGLFMSSYKKTPIPEDKKEGK